MKAGHVKTSTFGSAMRFDASYHMSDGIEAQRMVSASPYPMLTIDDVSEDVFMGNRAKRVYVTDKKHGLPFLSSSDILQADLENVKLASIKYTPSIETQVLQPGWTLISRSGTVGNCAFATRKHAQKQASEDVIRLKPNNILRAGLIYAYLASKYGHSLLTQGVFGAVIQHIEPAFIKSLPIPYFPKEFQQEVDSLIQTSAQLREEAADLLAEAVSYFDGLQIDHINQSKNGLIPLRKISTGFKRFDAQYQLGKQDHNKILNTIPTKKIYDFAEAIFIGNRDKRQYVEAEGTPFLSSSDMILANPIRWCKYISKKAKALSALQVKGGDILISRSGTVGNTIIVGEYLNGAAVSEHALRLRINSDKIAPEYVFAFLRSQIGQHALCYLSYGSVIVTLGDDYVGDIDLPILDESKITDIVKLVKDYTSKWDESNILENKAIRMVEAEIEKWNK